MLENKTDCAGSISNQDKNRKITGNLRCQCYHDQLSSLNVGSIGILGVLSMTYENVGLGIGLYSK